MARLCGKWVANDKVERTNSGAVMMAFVICLIVGVTVLVSINRLLIVFVIFKA